MCTQMESLPILPDTKTQHRPTLSSGPTRCSNRIFQYDLCTILPLPYITHRVPQISANIPLLHLLSRLHYYALSKFL
jgi:hypothetical protein